MTTMDHTLLEGEELEFGSLTKPMQLPTRFRVLHYLYTRNFVNKGRHYTSLSLDDKFMLTCLIKKKPFNLPNRILDTMLKAGTIGKKNSDLPYPTLVSKILDHCKVWYLERGEQVNWSPEFDIVALKRMGIRSSMHTDRTLPSSSRAPPSSQKLSPTIAKLMKDQFSKLKKHIDKKFDLMQEEMNENFAAMTSYFAQIMKNLGDHQLPGDEENEEDQPHAQGEEESDEDNEDEEEHDSQPFKEVAEEHDEDNDDDEEKDEEEDDEDNEDEEEHDKDNEDDEAAVETSDDEGEADHDIQEEQEKLQQTDEEEEGEGTDHEMAQEDQDEKESDQDMGGHDIVTDQGHEDDQHTDASKDPKEGDPTEDATKQMADEEIDDHLKQPPQKIVHDVDADDGDEEIDHEPLHSSPVIPEQSSDIEDTQFPSTQLSIVPYVDPHPQPVSMLPAQDTFRGPAVQPPLSRAPHPSGAPLFIPVHLPQSQRGSPRRKSTPSASSSKRRRLN